MFYNLIKYPIMKLILAIIVGLVYSKNMFIEQQAIIELINNLKITWKTGNNKYLDGKIVDEIKSPMGVLETPDELKLPEKDIEPLEDILTEFDPI